jgi:hypothetical protein
LHSRAGVQACVRAEEKEGGGGGKGGGGVRGAKAYTD